MVQDFGDLKEIMMKVVHDTYDHKLILYTQDPLLDEIPVDRWDAVGFNVVCINCVPTAENLAKVWYILIERKLRKHVPWAQLNYVKVWETPNCDATFYGSNDDSSDLQ